MRKTLSIIFLTLLLPAPGLWAQEANALSFTQVERDPVNAALAGAGSGYAGNASVKAFSGAALLPFTEGKLDASLGYQRWAADASDQLQAAAAFRVLPKLVVSAGYVEPSLAGVPEGATFQFERTGYFACDRDSSAGRPVFNRTCSLKDSYKPA